MNIILTNFAGDNKSPIERSVDKVDKSLSSTDKFFNKMENDRDKEEFRKEKALRKGEVGNYSPPKKNNPPPDPSKNNPSVPSQMNPAINAVPVGKSSKEEEKMASDLGFASVTLGKRILRAETACVALTSIVAFSLGELGELPSKCEGQV